MPITPFPATPPSTSDPANFDARGDALVGHLPVFVADANALQEDVNAKAVIVSANALAAQQASNAAQQAVVDAAAAAGATKWIPGDAYTQGAVVWSPANYLNYRRKVAGAGATDPSLDAANWALMGAPLAAPMQDIAVNTLAVLGMHYLILAPLTLTLPSLPTVRDTVQFTNLTGATTSVIDPNGALIRGVAGPMALNSPLAARTLTYSGASKGWI